MQLVRASCVRPSDARFTLFCWSAYYIRLAFEHDWCGIRVWFVNTEGSAAAFAVDLCTQRSLYIRVSFCDGSFYDDSILRPLSSRTEHSRLVHHCQQLKRPFSTYCASSSSPVCLCFFLFCFSAVLLSWLWFFYPRQNRRKNQNSWRHILSWCLLNHGLGLLQHNRKWFDWYFFFQLSV